MQANFPKTSQRKVNKNKKGSLKEIEKNKKKKDIFIYLNKNKKNQKIAVTKVRCQEVNKQKKKIFQM